MANKRATVLIPLVLLLVTTVGSGQSPNVQKMDDDMTGLAVERDTDKGLLFITLPSQNGKLAWEDVLRAVMRVAQLEDRVFDGTFPTGSLDLTQSYSRLSLAALNLTLRPDIRFEIVTTTAQQPASLRICVDEDALQQRRRKIAKKIRDQVAKNHPPADQFGLHLPPDLSSHDVQQPLVIVVHGFNSSPARFAPLVKMLTDDGILSAAYSYRDDQPIMESADQLSADLKQLASDHPQRPIALVTHSMGGLVSRAVIEQAALDPGNVTKLIMVAPPSHGSLLAQFAFGIDILDHIADHFLSNETTRFYALIEDGLSEARNDLKPQSLLLRKLNALPRNPKVRYSIFLGTGGHLQQSQIDMLRQKVRSAAEENTAVELFTPILTATLDDLDEVIEGKGDGVVAVKRGRLEGVTDTLICDFSHLSVLQSTYELENDVVYQGLLKRLRE